MALHKPVCNPLEKLHPCKNFCTVGEKKVRFEESEKAVNAVRKPSPAKKPWLTVDAVVLKDKVTGELPPFGETIEVGVPRDKRPVSEMPEIRLKGKLKWLFEQDRMFWASNSAKSSLRSSPEVDLVNGLRAAKKHGECDDSKVSNVEGIEIETTRKSSLANKLNKSDNPTISRTECTAGDLRKLPAGNMFSRTNSSPILRPHGNSKSQPSKVSSRHNKDCLACKAPEVGRHHSIDQPAESMTVMSSFDLSGEDFSDDDETLDSEDSSECSSRDEQDQRREYAGRRSSAKELDNETTFLKLKCDLLSKQKDNAVRRWKQSCVELEQAAKMAQALRTAIETLLQAGDTKADFKTKQENLEVQTQALKARMEKLRRKSSEGTRKHCNVKRTRESVEGRIKMSREITDQSLASPAIPRGTEHTVEALRARLEKLMLATNHRVADDQGEPTKEAREEKKLVKDYHRQKKFPHEKGELKMKCWFNSLSAELSTQEPPSSSGGVCEKYDGAYGRLLLREMGSADTPFASKPATPSHPQATPFTSKQATPSTSKQVSPLHPVHESPCSAPSSEETKKNVIHKIAEEVRLEAEQWFQVQELLQRVGQDMKTLHEACNTWERRAIRAEAQVAFMHHEGQERETKAHQVGDQKFMELQKELLRLTETVEEVRKQLGGIISTDPSRWFEAAKNFGYAFMPVSLHTSNTTCGCKGADPISCSHISSREPSGQGQCQDATLSSLMQPSSSTKSTKALAPREKTRSFSELRRMSQLPSQQWAKEIARAEEEELTSTTSSGQSAKLYANSLLKGDAFCTTTGGKMPQKAGKNVLKDPGFESGGSRDIVRQMQPSTRERCTSHQEEQLPRYPNVNSMLRRSPLRDVLENRASSKENKRPSER